MKYTINSTYPHSSAKEMQLSILHLPYGKEFSNGIFCVLLSRPFDTNQMTQGQGQSPRVTARKDRNRFALFSRRVYRHYSFQATYICITILNMTDDRKATKRIA